MITEGNTTIPLETTRRAFGNQEKSKQRSTIVYIKGQFPIEIKPNVHEIFFMKIGSVNATDIATRDPKGEICRPTPATTRQLVMWVRIYAL